MLIISPKTRRKLELGRRALLTGAAAVSAFEGLKLSDAQAQSTCGIFYPSSSPAQAQAAGMNVLKFREDFNIAGTVAQTSGATSGFNFFLQNGSTYGSNVTVNTSGTAAGISNGNTGGGSFPSANGGLLVISGPNGNGNVSICSTPESTQLSSNPGFGNWKYFYAHVYAQMNNSAMNHSLDWFAPLWLDSQLSIPLTPPLSTLGGAGYTEFDVVELYGNDVNFSYTAQQMTSGGHQWQVNNATQISSGGGTWQTGSAPSPQTQINYDNGWHLWGVLWKPNGTGAGQLSIYYDNQLAATFGNSTTIATGSGGAAGYQWMDAGGPMYLKLGGPASFNMYVDYIEVWQAS